MLLWSLSGKYLDWVHCNQELQGQYLANVAFFDLISYIPAYKSSFFGQGFRLSAVVLKLSRTRLIFVSSVLVLEIYAMKVLRCREHGCETVGTG